MADAAPNDSPPAPILIDAAAIRRHLPMTACIEVMRDAFATLARGDALLPLRPMLRLPGGPNIFALMPAYLGAPRCVGVKVLTVFPVNHGTPIDAHQGAVLLFEAEHGQLLAVLDATTITAIRTAAVSGLATRLLARADADTVAILGAGTQGREHLEAIRAVRPVKRAAIWSRTRAHAEALAAHAREAWDLDARVAPSAEDAVRGASIVCTTTASAEPVLQGAWLAPGAHVNAVGACIPSARELDTEAVVRARLFVDRRESALAEPGDILTPLREGAIDAAHIVAELGELVLAAGDRRAADSSGRRSDDEITLFKSLGLAIEDLAAGWHVYERVRAVSAAGAR